MGSARINVKADANRLQRRRAEPLRICYTLCYTSRLLRPNEATVSDAEKESEVLRLLRGMESKLDLQFDDTNGRIERLAGTFASGLQSVREQLRTSEICIAAETDELVRALAEYHATAIGNGVRLRDLDRRIRRLERVVGVSSPEPK